MNLVWLLSIFVLCVGAIDGKGALNPGVVNIGVILSFSTIDGRVSNISLRMAEQDVNSDPSVLGGRRLSLKMHDANRSGFLSIMGALQFMETDSVAIIGPQSAVMAHVLSHLANELQVPFLSYTALDPTMSPLQYPFFVQTAPHDLFLMAAIAEMVSYFRWGEVIAIFSDDDQSRNGITTLGDKLDERRCKISYKAALPPSERATRDDVEKELLKIKMMESRVIVLHTLNSTGRLVFNVAQSLGMTKAGYVWIASSWLSTALDSTSPLPKETTKSIQGAITFRLHVPDSKRKRDFVSRFKKLSNGTIGLNPFGLYAYDTVWILARALKLFFDDGNNISFSNDPNLSGLRGGALNLGALNIFDGGKLLLDKIIKTNTTGLTGPVWFNADRSFSRPSYDIVNVVGDGDHLIGYWSNYSGLSVVPPEKLYTKPANRSSSNQKLNKVVWPGGVTETPRGWVFPYNGRKLRIGVPNRFSYKAIVAKNGSEVQGYCIDVFLAAIKQLPYAVPHRFIPFGDGRQNPDYNELTKKITTGEFDAVVGDIAIVTNRTRMVDFTQPYIESGLVVVTKVRKPNSSAWAFLRPFTPLMWAVTGIFFLVVGAVVWILEHRINDDFRGPPKKQIVTMLWFSFSTMFFAHRENTVSTLGRIVLIIWLFVVLIINSSYTASLTSILTVQQLSSPIKGIDSLITSNQRIGYQVGSFAKNYLMEELSIPKSRLVALGSPEAYAQALENGTVVAVVDERPYVDIFLTEHCDFTIRGQEFTKSGWGFAFPRDSPLAMDLSTAILTLSENGQLQKIHNKWLSKESCASEESDTDSDQLHLQSFWGLFLICGIACFLALVIYFSLMFREFKKYGHGQTNDPPSTLTPKSTPRRLQKFFSFADERVDTSKLKRKRGNDVAMNGSYRNEDGPRNGSGRIHVEIDNNPHRRNFDGT